MTRIKEHDDGGGIVYLVGAGPGSPDLISLRAIRILRQADVIVCDNLLPKYFLNYLGISGEHRKIIWREEVKGSPCQQDINNLLCEEAQAGSVVVHLKTGDPLVFGRTGEEIAALERAGVPWCVVPGISSCTAAPAEAGVLITDRGVSRSFAVVSASCEGGESNQKYPDADSLVVLMGVHQLESVVSNLLRKGFAPEVLVTIVERATLPFERQVTAPLEDIVKAASEANIVSPAVIMVGKSRGVGDRLRHPIILFTGLDPAAFLGMGRVIHWPALCIVPEDSLEAQAAGLVSEMKDDVLKTLIFSGKAGVSLFFNALASQNTDARIFSRKMVIAAGQGTALALEEKGICADLVFRQDSAGELGRAYASFPKGNVTVIGGGREGLGMKKCLEDLGVDAKSIITHTLVQNPQLGGILPFHDIIYFVSPAGADAYWKVYGKEGFNKPVHCIGKETQYFLKSKGIQAKIQNPYRG